MNENGWLMRNKDKALGAGRFATLRRGIMKSHRLGSWKSARAPEIRGASAGASRDFGRSDRGSDSLSRNFDSPARFWQDFRAIHDCRGVGGGLRKKAIVNFCWLLAFVVQMLPLCK